MDQRLKSYLRPHRRRWGFTQQEIAFLIGIKSSTSISRIERLKRIPTFEVAFALGLIFGAAPGELFPANLMDVQQSVLHRANELYEQLQGDASKRTRIKLDFLEALLARLEQRSADDV